jgi:hypothetical protein
MLILCKKYILDNNIDIRVVREKRLIGGIFQIKIDILGECKPKGIDDRCFSNLSGAPED